jgi:hypothetical protein
LHARNRLRSRRSQQVPQAYRLSQKVLSNLFGTARTRPLMRFR